MFSVSISLKMLPHRLNIALISLDCIMDTVLSSLDDASADAIGGTANQIAIAICRLDSNASVPNACVYVFSHLIRISFVLFRELLFMNRNLLCAL